MSRALLALGAAACIAAGDGALRASQARPTVPFFEQTQRWFELVRAHKIGEWDESTATVARFSPSMLELIRTDLRIVYLLLDGAVTKGNTRVEVPGKTLELSSLPRLIGVPAEDLALPRDPKKLPELGDRHITARRVLTRIMTRAAMMHTRIALERSAEPGPETAPPGSVASQRQIDAQASRRPGATLIRDGRSIRIPNRAIHWAIARAAFDIDGPPRAASATARLWYQAAAEYMQQERDYSALLPHLEQARANFKLDALYFFFSGAAYENLAAPRIQAAAEEFDAGVRALGSPAELLVQADKYFRQALDLDPDLALAQLRRGRVLTLTKRYEEAVTALRKAESSLTDPPARYLSLLFLGKAEQALGHDTEARAAYERAGSLYPAAQSPKLALASMAWRANDRAAAGAGVRALAGLETANVSADPFWTYDAVHVGDVPALFERLRLMAIEAAK